MLDFREVRKNPEQDLKTNFSTSRCEELFVEVEKVKLKLRPFHLTTCLIAPGEEVILSSRDFYQKFDFLKYRTFREMEEVSLDLEDA